MTIGSAPSTYCIKNGLGLNTVKSRVNKCWKCKIGVRLTFLCEPKKGTGTKLEQFGLAFSNKKKTPIPLTCLKPRTK